MEILGDKIIEDKIKELLPKYLVKQGRINTSTTLQSLNLVSEEIDQFFYDFFKFYSIDSKGFDYYDYFFEQVHPLIVIKDLFYRIFKPEKVKKKMITIGHLVKVAKAGKWIMPEG